MSISFSGLASGLDTSSWVESLTALKQAKVTSLKEEKETVLLSKDTLNSIKSFFASFRSTIERITDTKFNIVTMDLFAQNIATSANLNVLTASATTEAEEGVYNVKVDKLATNTQAISNYSYRTTIVETTTATADSKLIHLGVTAGNIGVTVNGIEHGINITNTDTIATFIEKLKEIGVEASYNENSGVFSMNIGEGDIRDIDNTKIVQALHLEGVNEGYETENPLLVSEEETVWETATLGTYLTELGVSTGTITVHANDRDYSIAITNGTTLGSFVADLNANNIDASFDVSEGIFTLTDAEITQENGTNIISKLGLEKDIYSKSQKTDGLLHEITVTESTTATSATLLKDIGNGTAIANGDTVVITNSNNEKTTLTIGTTTTIGDLLAGMTNAGLYAVINNDGTIEISGGKVEQGAGSTFDPIKGLGLESEPYTAMVTGNSLTETIIEYELVTMDTRLVQDLGVTEGYLEVTTADGDKFYEMIYSGQTIGDLMADLANLGIYSTLDEENGILEITGGAFRTLDNGHNEAASLIANGTIVPTNPSFPAQGTNLLECLYGSGVIATDQISVASAYSRTRMLTQSVTNIIDATTETTLGTLGLTSEGTAIFNVRGNDVAINVTAGMSIEGLMTALKNQGIESSWDEDNSRLTVNNATLTGGTSNLVGVLNMETTIAGKYVTSNALNCNRTITVDATGATTFEELGVNSNQTVVLNKEDGTTYTFNISGTTTMQSFLNTLNGQGVTAKIEDGIFSIEGGYITNTAIEEALGLTTNIEGFTNILGNKVTHTIITTASGDTTLSQVITALGTGSAVSGGYSLSFNSHSISVSSTTTLDQVMQAIHNLGGVASIDYTGRMHIDGGTLTGTVATALGFSSVSTTAAVGATGEILEVITTLNADGTTRLSDLNLGLSTITIKETDGVTVGTITTNADMTLNDLLTALSGYGISGTIKDGVITLKSDCDRYAEGGVITSLGIGTTSSTYTTTFGMTNSSSLVVSSTYTITADSSTTLSSLNLGASTITVSGDDGTLVGTITTNADMTIGDVLTALAGYGVSGTIKNGVINLDSDIGHYATGGVLQSMGVSTTSGTYTTTAGVTNSSTLAVAGTVVQLATMGSVIKDFITLPSDKTITVKDKTGATKGSVTVTDTMTFEQLFKELDDLGVQATISDGIISVTSNDGRYLTGDVLTQLGIGTTTTVTTVTTTVGKSTTGSAITYTENIVATMSSSVGSFVNLSSGSVITVKTQDGATRGTVTVTAGMSFTEMFDRLSTLGIQGTISDGVVTLTSTDGSYATGTILTNMGIDAITSTITLTSGTSVTSSAAVTGATVQLATMGSVIKDFITLPSDKTITVKDKTGATKGSVTVTDTMTFEQLFKELDDLGVQATISDGIISVTSNDGRYLTGDVLTQLGIGTTTTVTTVTTTVGKSTTGSAITYTENIVATMNSSVGSFVNLSSGSVITVKTQDGATRGTVTVTAGMSFTEMFDRLSTLGIQGTISDGVVTLTSTDGSYATGTILTNMGIEIVPLKTTLTSGTSATSSGAVTYTSTTYTTTFPTITQTLYTTDTIVVIEPVVGTKTITVTDTVTVKEVHTTTAEHTVTLTLTIENTTTTGSLITVTTEIVTTEPVVGTDTITVKDIIVTTIYTTGTAETTTVRDTITTTVYTTDTTETTVKDTIVTTVYTTGTTETTVTHVFTITVAETGTQTIYVTDTVTTTTVNEVDKTITIESTATVDTVTTVTVLQVATGDTKLSDLGITETELYIATYDRLGTQTERKSVTTSISGDTTLQQLIDIVSANSNGKISGEIQNGVLKFTDVNGAEGGYSVIFGDLADALGIVHHTSGSVTDVTIGNTLTSTTAITYTKATFGSSVVGTQQRIYSDTYVDNNGSIVGNSTTVEIRSTDALIAMSGKSYKDKYFVLIGDVEYYGSGINLENCTFNGQGYMLAASSVVFNTVKSNSTIQNLNIENIDSSSDNNAGIAKFASNSTFSKIQAFVDIDPDDVYNAGGIVAEADNCTFDTISISGEIRGTNCSDVGGIVGYGSDNTFQNLSITLSALYGGSNVAGIIGYSYGETTANNIVFGGDFYFNNSNFELYRANTEGTATITNYYTYLPGKINGSSVAKSTSTSGLNSEVFNLNGGAPTLMFDYDYEVMSVGVYEYSGKNLGVITVTSETTLDEFCDKLGDINVDYYCTQYNSITGQLTITDVYIDNKNIIEKLGLKNVNSGSGYMDISQKSEIDLDFGASVVGPYNKVTTGYENNSGTVYVVKTAAELQSLIDRGGNIGQATIYLGADITIDSSFTRGLSLFNCTFDGQGYNIHYNGAAAPILNSVTGGTIKNLSITGYINGDAALALSTNGTNIEKIRTGVLVNGSDTRVGGLVKEAESSIFSNICISGTIYSSDTDALLGGIVGTSIDSDFEECSINARYSGSYGYTAGEATGSFYNDNIAILGNDCGPTFYNCPFDLCGTPYTGGSGTFTNIFMYDGPDTTLSSAFTDPSSAPVLKFDQNYKEITVGCYDRSGNYKGQVTVNADTSLDDFCSALTAKGVTAAVSSTGAVNIGGYIDSPDIISKLNISTSNSASTQNFTQTGAYSDSTNYNATETVTISSLSTTLEQLGMSGHASIVIKKTEDESAYKTVVVHSSMSLNDLDTELFDTGTGAGIGISNGKVVLTPTSGYYFDIIDGGGFCNVLKLDESQDNTYTVVTTGTIVNSNTNSDGLFAEATQTVTVKDTVTTTGTATIKVQETVTSTENIIRTITVESTSTGTTVPISSTAKMETVTSASPITYVSGGSTITATGSTTIGNLLGGTSGTFGTIKLCNTDGTIQDVVVLADGMPLNDIANIILNSHEKIEASFENGKLSITAIDGTSLILDLDENLLDALNFEYGFNPNTVVYTVEDTVTLPTLIGNPYTHTVEATVTIPTITEHVVTYTVEDTVTIPTIIEKYVTHTVESTFTVDTADTKPVTHTIVHTLTIEHTTTEPFETILQDTITVIKAEEKLVTHTVTATFTVEDTTTRPVTITVIGTGTIETTTVSVSTTNTSMTLIADTALKELGLTGTYYITVNSSGTQNIVTVNSSDTIDEMLTSLAGLGIHGSIEDGRLTLKGDKDAYITQMTADLQTTLKLNGNYNTTYTVTTSVTTTSSILNYNNTSAVVDMDTLMSQRGITVGGSNTITIQNNGKDYTVTVHADDTVGDVLIALAGYGISGEINNGVITLTGSGDAYITAMGANVQTALGISNIGSGHTYSTTQVTGTSGFNTLSNTQDRTINVNLTSASKFNELGMSSSGTINLVSDGVAYTITVESSDTVDDMLTTLAGLGINGSVDANKIVLQGDSEAYITSMSDNIETALKLATNTTYNTTSTVTTGINTTSSILNYNNTSAVVDMDTLMSQRGITVGGSNTITIQNNGKDYTVTVHADDTVGDVLIALAGYGISGEINNGVITLTGSGDAYITAMGANVQTALGISNIGSGHTYSTTQVTGTSGFNTLSNTQDRTINVNLTSASKFNELGMSSSGTINLVSDGVAYTITVESSDTVDDMLTTLAGLGINGSVDANKIVLQGDSEAYITSMSDNIETALKLATNTVYYTTAAHTTQVNTDSNTQKYGTTNTLTTDDTFGLHGLTATAYVTLVSDGTLYTVTVETTDTVGDLISSLAGLGIHGSIEGGNITFKGDNEAYITQMTDQLRTVLKLSTTNYGTLSHTTTSNTDSNTQKVTVTEAATGTTQLKDLRNNGVAPSNYTFILSTTSDAGNQLVTLSFSATDTVYDVIDKLAEYGLNAYIDVNGRFSVSSSSLTDFDISGALGTFMMGAYEKVYDEGKISSVSTNLIQQTVVNMDDNTLMSKVGITNGNLVLYKDGVEVTIAIDNTKTIGDFRNILAEEGLITSIVNGKLQISADGVIYFTAPATGASNIITILGLDNNTSDSGDTSGYSQSSEHLFDTQTIAQVATMANKLSELTDGSGNNLDITDGSVYVYQDGTRSLVNINKDDTLETLASKLSQYGITVGIDQNGRVYFDGNNNSYITTDGIASASASNILTKLNISNNWSTRYNSTSEVLDYEVESDIVADGNTKLSDLQDENGNNLGITTGSYYVYQNGVRTTETITDDTTVNDFLATMATYGMSTNFYEDGSIGVGGYNETYLATSATSGDDTNAIDILFEQWNFVNVYTSNNLDIPTDVTVSISETTKLADINGANYQAGYITVVKDGVQTDIQLTADDTVGDLMDELALYGFESTINASGQLIIKNSGDSLLQAYAGAGASNALEILGINLSEWINTNAYESSAVSVVTTTTEDVSATRDTLLSELGVSTGEYYIYNNGVKYTALISTDETVGSLMDTLESFGLSASLVDKGATGAVISITGNGDSYVAKSVSGNASNVVETLFSAAESTYAYQGYEQTSTIVTHYTAATEDTLLSYYDNGALHASGDLVVSVNGVESTIKIAADETFGTLIDKFQALGLEATLTDGELMIQSGYDVFTIIDTSTSALPATIRLRYNDDLGGYVSSTSTAEQTTTTVEDRTLSVASYAGENTQMKLLNISDGSLTIYRDGEKATIQIDSNHTFSDLNRLISARFADVEIKFKDGILEDGYLTFHCKTDGVAVEVGSTTDTSNFSAVTGLSNDGSGEVRSARELYCVNNDSVLTTSGIFRLGDITEGTFFVGDAEFTITDTTKLSNLISQINASDSANATAYWDSIDGKLVIKSRTTGSALVNIEAGTSNFTDIMGFTNSEWDPATGDVTVTKMNVNAQEIGENAKFSINGTYYTSTSNTITSDVSRIKGLTINLKGVSEGASVELKVEKDKETVANAVSDIVDAYNELIENVDKQIAKGSPLDDQSTLKLIRNQIRNLMTGSLPGAGVFRNLDSVGISLEAASAGNIQTDNINVLTFNKEKFLSAFDADRDALKNLLVGTDSNLGIFQRIEVVVESAVAGASGYFASAEKSYNNQIQRLDKKIESAQRAVERYRERLEAKFNAMDLLISNIQNQYSSFLGT